MNDIPPPDTNLEALKQMVGAPDVDQPLLNDDAFQTEEVHSDRPAWKLPIPKLMLIGGALLPVFAFAGYFMMSSQQLGRPEVATSPPNAGVDTARTNEASEELTQAREEIASLKSRMALNDQAYIQTQRVPQNQPGKPVVEVPRQVPERRTQATSSRPTGMIRPVPSPPVVSYRPPPPQIQMGSSRNTAPVSQTAQATQLDPVEQWQQLAQLGSYGAIAPPETLPLERSSRTNPGQQTLVASASGIPTAQVAPTSTVSRTAPGSIDAFDWHGTTTNPTTEEMVVQNVNVENYEFQNNSEVTEEGTVGNGELDVEAIATINTGSNAISSIDVDTEEAIATNTDEATLEPPTARELADASSSATYPAVLTDAETTILGEHWFYLSLCCPSKGSKMRLTGYIKEAVPYGCPKTSWDGRR